MADITHPTIAASIHSPAAARWNRLLAWLMAALLLLASIAKAYQAMHMKTNAILLPEAVFEAGLALWLGSGLQCLWARRISLLVFAGFAIVSLVKIHRGAVSCGCFGAIRISPIAMFLLDTTIVAALIVVSAKPSLDGRLLNRHLIFCSSAAAIVSISAVIGIKMVRPASLPRVSPVAEIATTEPSGPKPDAVGVNVAKTEWLANAGVITGGRRIRAVFNVQNPSDRALKIIDVDPSCGCTNVPNPPDVLPTGIATTIEVTVDVSQEPGDFEQSVELTTDDPRFHTLLLRVGGNVK